MKKIIILCLIFILSISVVGCGNKPLKNEKNPLITGKFDTYMDSFIDELDDYLDNDFETLKDGAELGEISADWVTLFNDGKEKIGHMSSEYSAAQMIVPENGKQEYNAVAGVVTALNSLFIMYTDITDSEKATSEKIEEFYDAADAILIVWDEIN